MKISPVIVVFLFLAASSSALRVEIGNMSSFDLAAQPQMAYKAHLKNIYLNGTITPTMEAILIFDPSGEAFYYSDPTSSYYFLSQGSYYVVGGYYCEVIPDTYYGNVTQEFSGLFLTGSIEGWWPMYNGIIEFTFLPNAVSILLSNKGLLKSMVFSGPPDSEELFMDILTSSYAVYDHSKLGCKDWAVIPPLPPSCPTSRYPAYKSPPCLNIR